MKSRVRFCLSVLVALFSLTPSLLAPKVSAQAASEPSALKLTTSPLPISLVGKPGERVTTKLSVKNGGTADETLKVGLMKFSAYGEEGKPDLKDREEGDDYFDWVTFSEESFVVQPDTWHDIVMTVDLPVEASLGYYYAVTFSRLNLPVSDQSNLLQGGTAVLVLVEARVDDAVRDLRVEEFSTSKRIYEFLPSEFNVKLYNAGNIHMPATGNIFIKHGSKTVATLEVNRAAGNILPNSRRIFTAQWDEGFPAYVPVEQDGKIQLKDGQQVYKLKWDISKVADLRFGKYTANLVMSYDNGTRDIPLEAVVSFWVIPWRLLAGTILPLLLISVLVFKYLKLRGRMKKLENTKKAS